SLAASSCTSWDDIFEASDLWRDKNAITRNRPAPVKRGLFINQLKDEGDMIGNISSGSPSANVSLESLSKILYPCHLKVLVAKLALNSGKSHLNTRGKFKKARQIREPCHAHCKKCEHQRLTEVEPCTIFNRFWSLNNHELQWKLISDSIKILPPKRKIALVVAKGEKKYIRSYYFAVNGKLRKMCKTMFKNTLCICDSWIDSALSHVHNNKNHIPDMRGKAEKK
ncbi:Visual pigment-like receptor peropsin, partial [Frankliniella fusca]